MKVIFLTNIPMIRQHRIDMYVDTIAENYDIELWDLSPIYGNNEVLQSMEQESVKINNLEFFNEKLKEEVLKDRVVVVTNILIYNLKFIYPFIHALGIPIINISKESMGAWIYNVSAINHRKMIGFTRYLKALMHHNPITRRILNYYHNGIVKYDYQLASYNFFPEENRHFIKIHNVKYDEFIGAQEEKSIIDGEYILFIDAAIVDHPMFNNRENKIDRNVYLNQLNHYFMLLEKKYNIPVVISAHPKSCYSNTDFKGRKIIMYKTPVLIRHAKYIIAHYSTSLYDSILQRKPIKVMYSYELVHTAAYTAVLPGMQVAEFVGAEKVNLNNPALNDFTVSECLYSKFANMYILNKNKTNYRNKDLILDFFNGLNSK